MSPGRAPQRTRQARGKGAKRRRQPAILVFAEDKANAYDSKAVASLVVGLRPDLAGSVHPRRRPLVLLRDASADDIRRRRAKLERQLEIERKRLDVRAIVVHEDCDAVEPAHVQLDATHRKNLSPLGVEVVPSVPAWELETWWLLWPDLLPQVRSTWSSPSRFKNKDVGSIEHSKEVLAKALIPSGLSAREKARFRSYKESDAPAVAEAVAKSGRSRSPDGKSKSYELFVKRLDDMPW